MINEETNYTKTINIIEKNNSMVTTIDFKTGVKARFPDGSEEQKFSATRGVTIRIIIIVYLEMFVVRCVEQHRAVSGEESGTDEGREARCLPTILIEGNAIAALRLRAGIRNLDDEST